MIAANNLQSASRKSSIGIIEAFRFTNGSAGNQFTRIDGVEYVTFWDLRSKDWQIGDTVRYRPYLASLWSGQPKVAHADCISKVAPNSEIGS